METLDQGLKANPQKWTKWPSVTRPGKSFYRATIKGVSYTVLQSRITGLWNVENNTNASLSHSEFKTAKAACKAIELLNRVHKL